LDILHAWRDGQEASISHIEIDAVITELEGRLCSNHAAE